VTPTRQLIFFVGMATNGEEIVKTNRVVTMCRIGQKSEKAK